MRMKGIVQQKLDEDTDCIDSYCRLSGYSQGKEDAKCPYLSNIKTIFFTKLDARGPTYARHLQHSLMQDEEFCLQMDSHMDTVKVRHPFFFLLANI